MPDTLHYENGARWPHLPHLLVVVMLVIQVISGCDIILHRVTICSKQACLCASSLKAGENENVTLTLVGKLSAY